ncbi:aminodeoxychorismate lyase [Marinomonas sp. 2405UD68-3]|uniref:aminodeoxychorismate lyase n=1 Tax=Marinomonas sp. 2405UD68-3 TaxID=3391835 RepID=UPI0039C9A05D
MTTYLNYTLNDSLPLNDRSISYGDGLFETLFVENNQVHNFPDHLQRLSRSCLKLNIPFNSAQQVELFDFITNLAASFHDPHVIKVIVSRGAGGRGYLPNSDASPTVIISTSIAPNYSQQSLLGVSLGISSIPSGMNRYLAGMKHLNRLENVMAKGRLTKGCFEDVMLDGNGFLAECIQSNLFWFKNEVLHTPILNQSGVQGTMRSRVLRENTHFPIEIGSYLVGSLMSADEIFITNSLIGVVPITNFIGQSLPIGINTRKIKNIMNY